MPMGTDHLITESFLALKQVVGRSKPPLGQGDYKEMMNDRAWYKDPRTDRKWPPHLCARGWHAFPLNRLIDWWPNSRWGDSRWGDERKPHIWVVEMSGKAQFDNQKMCAQYIRFVDELKKEEIELLRDANLPTDVVSSSRAVGYDQWKDVKDEYLKAAQGLGLEGLVFCCTKFSTVNRQLYQARYTPQLLRVPAVKKVKAA